MNKLFGGLELQIKADNSMEFTAYGNVKNVLDHANDVAMDGCYTNSIKRHKENETSPKLLWSHNPYDMPLGKIHHMEEDSKGLLFAGKLSKTTRGLEAYELAKDNALEEFSIGYLVNQERWNSEKSYNELIEIDIKEISFVNFACNEASRLQSIKSKLQKDELPDRRELEQDLRSLGYSRKEAVKIASRYCPEKDDEIELINLAKGLELFKNEDELNEQELKAFAQTLFN